MKETQNNKRIAKNTLVLYFRQLFNMFIALFTVRIILDELGTVDYGIYNVVAGVVVMFSFVSGIMGTASQRYLSFDIGKNDMPQLQKTFSQILILYVIAAFIILVLAETIGLWFVKTQLNFPDTRANAALWVYHFSIFSFVLTIINIPYNAAVFAYEKMNMYAYVSMLETILKLVIVYILALIKFDKLIVYSILIFTVTSLITLIYRIYVTKKFPYCKYRYFWDKEFVKNMLGFSGWNLFGAFANIINNQGINVVLNVFFGPVVNAARAIAFQVSAKINQFVLSFFSAVNPQIIKLHAAGEKQSMIRLVMQSSKLAYFLIFVLSIPFLFETNFILKLWLKEVPEYVVLFTRLIIINALIESLAFPLRSAAQATGDIKKYQSIVGGIMLLNLPISLLFYHYGAPPQSTFVINIFITVISQIARIYLLSQMIGLPKRDYYMNIILKVLLVSLIVYSIVFSVFIQLNAGVYRFLIILVFGFISCLLVIYYIGLIREERLYVINQLKKTVKLKKSQL